MKKKADIACLNCGKLFHPARKESKFCCRECSIQYNKEHGVMKKTEEQRKKLSEAHMGKEPWNKGRVCSEEELARMSETSKKFWAKDGFRQKMSNIQKEAWSDKELRNRHSRILKEVNSTPEVKKKISDGLNKYYNTVDPEVLTERYKKQVETKNTKGWTYTSEGENAVINYVKELGYKPEKYVYGKGNTRFEIDCYIPELKIGIEYNGIYYHASNGSNKKPINYHFKKSEHAMNDLGIELIHIWEDQWKKQNAIIKDILRTRLKKVENKIPARKCIIKEIPTNEYRDFCINHHIQRFRTASVRLGLYYNDMLVQVASFGKPGNYGNANSDRYEWEWIRACTEFNTIVMGGTSKLFKYFVNTYKPKSILCYADWNLFSGSGYEKLGFEFLSFTGPDLFFIRNSSALERINRNPYTNSLHRQMVNEGKLFECHGCGSKKFVWYSE